MNQSSGPLYPGTVANDSTVGTQDWLEDEAGTPGLNGAKTEDADTVLALGNTPIAADITTRYLKLTNYGFAIPTTATIVGVEFKVKLSALFSSLANSDLVYDNLIKLVKGGTISGTSQARAATSIWPTSLTYITFGSNSNLWGLSLTPADINASTFGGAVSAIIGGSGVSGKNKAFIDTAGIIVYYTLPAATMSPGFFGPGIGIDVH